MHIVAMRKIMLLVLLVQATVTNYGQIIADHTIVDNYDDIPQYYLDQVKKMWVVIAGESHSLGYRDGLLLLEGQNSIYSVSVKESGTPEPYTSSNLRVSRAAWGDYSNASGWVYNYGEEDWWTNSVAVSRTKAGLSYCNNNNLPVSAFGFGWCWDPMAGSASIGTDPVTGNHWYGWSIGSSSGDKCWGIDEADDVISGNVVNIDDYILATQDYIDYCVTNLIPTKVFFTTGPVDNGEGSYVGEAMYQAHLKYEQIRNYVKANNTRMLFDYADILCYDNNGILTTNTWNGHTFPTITPTNLSPIRADYHISESGALRLAKAMWWMLARVAGWDGSTTGIDENKESNSSSLFSIEMNNTEIRIKINKPDSNSTISLYNLNGNLIVDRIAYTDLCIINVSNFPAGIYIVIVSSPTGSETQKIVVSKG
jgi:hypothetical protein